MKIRFSDFELDQDRFLLLRKGERVPLRPKAFDLLVQLAQHRNRVVLREELIEAIWGGMAVGPGSLSGLVNELRQALGEDGRSPSFIRTVHARGYQFVAAAVEVDRVAESVASARDVSAPAGDVSDRVALLLEHVAAEGSQGIVLRSPDAQGTTRMRTPDARARRPLAPGTDFEALLSGAEASGFEVRTLAMPDESMATPGRFARQIIDSLVVCRGAEAVRTSLPLPARVWFEEQESGRVAGGFGTSVNAPPGGLGAAARALSELARRRPLVWVLDGIDRAGPRIARDLATLATALRTDPVLWIGTLCRGQAAAATVRAVEGEAGFAVWDAPTLERNDLSERLRRMGRSPLPNVLNAALLAHVDGDHETLDEITRWMEWETRRRALRSTHEMRRVEPRAASRSATGIDPSP